MALKLYSIFHMNLLYSSIPESKRGEVIERCLWPLLKLAVESRIPIAIESPAYTLELISKLDPAWPRTLRSAIRSNVVEFLGSGYSQIVAPIVPADVNGWNLKLGAEQYKRILGASPSVWYINEQAYSAGIVEHYTSLGIQGIVMEWNNPRTLHPEWNDEYRHYPQVAVGTNGSRIPLIWNDSISFQKFQRCAHGDLEVDDLISYLIGHMSERGRYHCLYGNDAEIFDFRPGRFKTEPDLENLREWSRIASLYGRLQADPRFQLIFPSDALNAPRVPSASYVDLSLESAAQPVPVKKQPKYNVTRWSVTGRDSLYVNTLCYRLYMRIKRIEEKGLRGAKEIKRLKRRLCYLWSSDFRTHITSDRWDRFVEDLEDLLQATSFAELPGSGRTTIALNGLCATFTHTGEKGRGSTPSKAWWCDISEDKKFLSIATPSVRVLLNLKRGLAIHSLIFPELYPEALAGTIPHGYFEDIALSADWYTGNTILQRPGEPQITDLVPVEVETMAGLSDEEPWFGVSTVVPTQAGPIRKLIKIYKSLPQVDLDYTFDWKKIPVGSFKTAVVTLIPTSYDLTSLFYATHNGGSSAEIFKLRGQTVAHNVPASSVVSASSGLGATEGIVISGDSRKALAMRFDPSICASTAMVAFRETVSSFFERIMFSCGEMDESRAEDAPGPLRFVCSIAGMGRR